VLVSKVLGKATRKSFRPEVDAVENRVKLAASVRWFHPRCCQDRCPKATDITRIADSCVMTLNHSLKVADLSRRKEFYPDRDT